MSKALSLDLRTRVLAAIGLSCREAAQRFGVSASSAIRWRALDRRQADARPKALGGDRRSARIEARAGLIDPCYLRRRSRSRAPGRALPSPELPGSPETAAPSATSVVNWM